MLHDMAANCLFCAMQVAGPSHINNPAGRASGQILHDWNMHIQRNIHANYMICPGDFTNETPRFTLNAGQQMLSHA
jgi:hypothetical protein